MQRSDLRINMAQATHFLMIINPEASVSMSHSHGNVEVGKTRVCTTPYRSPPRTEYRTLVKCVRKGLIELEPHKNLPDLGLLLCLFWLVHSMWFIFQDKGKKYLWKLCQKNSQIMTGANISNFSHHLPNLEKAEKCGLCLPASDTFNRNKVRKW